MFWWIKILSVDVEFILADGVDGYLLGFLKMEVILLSLLLNSFA